MTPHIEQAVLDAASAGANPAPPDRLRAAADYVMEQTQPKQLILFGSAARGEFSDDSDFDFAVVQPARGADRQEGHEKWACPSTDDEIDVLWRDAGMLEAGRWTAGTVHCSIMAEGRTIFAEPGPKLITTMPDAGENVAELVKKGRYKPGTAKLFAWRARKYLQSASDRWRNDFKIGACENLYDASEQALKALIIGNGSPAAYGRKLGELWNRAVTLGEKIDAQRNDSILNAAARYTDREGCLEADAEEAAKIFGEFRRLAEELVEWTEKRVPQLLTKHDDGQDGTADSNFETQPLEQMLRRNPEGTATNR